MAELKTKPTVENVVQFLNGVTDDRKRQDCFTVLALMKEVTGAEPVMWGSSIVGFGSYHYKYASGREGDSILTGFSPRKQNLTLYLMGGFEGKAAGLLKSLGKHKTGKGCLYVNSLDDVDKSVLRKLVEQSIEYVRTAYPEN